MTDPRRIDAMRDATIKLVKSAEQAAYDWFTACPMGDERNRAYNVYQIVLAATRR